MELIIISTILCTTLFDFTVTGFLPKYFNIWPALNNLLGEVLIEQSLFLWSTLNFKIDTFGYREIGTRQRRNLRLALTSKFLLLKNTRRTYVWKVDHKSINSYEVKLSIVGKIIILHFSQEGKPQSLEFRPVDLEEWSNRLSEIGIPNKSKDEPVFPVKKIFFGDDYDNPGEESYENLMELACNLEWFDSEDPEENASILDAQGRPVHLKIVALDVIIFELKD